MNTAEALKRSQASLKLPSLPGVVTKLNQMISKSDVSVQEIGKLLSEDPELSMRVLRIANSALFGLATPVLDPRHAASILGLNRLHSIILQAAATGAFDEKRARKDPVLLEHWRHSILVGHIARDLGERAKNPGLMSPEELHIAGMLHDSGKAIFYDCMRAEYEAALSDEANAGLDELTIEKKTFGMHHGQLGAKLVLAWDLPRQLAQTIAFHHSPWNVAKAIPSAVLISVADRLAHAVAKNDLECMPHVADRRDLFCMGVSLSVMLSIATKAIRDWQNIEL